MRKWETHGWRRERRRFWKRGKRKDEGKTENERKRKGKEKERKERKKEKKERRKGKKGRGFDGWPWPVVAGGSRRWPETAEIR